MDQSSSSELEDRLLELVGRLELTAEEGGELRAIEEELDKREIEEWWEDGLEEAQEIQDFIDGRT